jgi:hypothetical protein
MPEPVNDRLFDALVGELYPLATQAARIVAHLADTPVGMDSSDRELSSRLGDVSAEHVAIVRRSLIENGLAIRSSFATRLVASASVLTALADNLRGIAAYLRVHKDRDAVRLVLTEPGLKSALRRAIDDAQALPPVVFQTSDAFFNLARGAKQELVILSPYGPSRGRTDGGVVFDLPSGGASCPDFPAAGRAAMRERVQPTRSGFQASQSVGS